MTSRWIRVGGRRLLPLTYSDVPRVAQAITDAIRGKARVTSGISGDTPFVKFVRDQSYVVVIRGDDWRKIFPFFRYSTDQYEPVIPPLNQPDPIPGVLRICTLLGNAPTRCTRTATSMIALRRSFNSCFLSTTQRVPNAD
jgi:hypothetical protein